MANDPLTISLHWFSFAVSRCSGLASLWCFHWCIAVSSFLSQAPHPTASPPPAPGAFAVMQLSSLWWYSSLPKCQMFLDRNKLHFFMAYGKLPWLLLLLYPLCELNMYSVACCLRCYCRVTYGTDSIRMKLALDNPSDYMHPDRLLLGLPSVHTRSLVPAGCRFSLWVIISATWDKGRGDGGGVLCSCGGARPLRQTDRQTGRQTGNGWELKGLYLPLSWTFEMMYFWNGVSGPLCQEARKVSLGVWSTCCVCDVPLPWRWFIETFFFFFFTEMVRSYLMAAMYLFFLPAHDCQCILLLISIWWPTWSKSLFLIVRL